MAAVGSRLGEPTAARSRAGLSVYRSRLPRDAGRPDAKAILSPELDALADRVRRLLPSHRDPESFHVERDAIERALRRLARGARPR